MLTVTQVEGAMPAHLRSTVSQALVDKINTVATDPLVAENIRENFISYTGILRDGKFKVQDYLSAVMYVSYKLMGDSNQDAWAKTFPDRYQSLIERGASPKDVSSHVVSYNKGKLVNLIWEQTHTPSWVLNQEVYQKAINIQAHIMCDPDVSAKVRSDAANSILTHLKKPDSVGPLVNFNMVEPKGMSELMGTLNQLAEQQRVAIASGSVSAAHVAQSNLVQVEDAVIIDG